MSTHNNNSVTFKPYERQGEHLVAGIFNSGGLNVTVSEYNSVRQGITIMRSKDPAAGALYDKYLGDVVMGQKKWSGAEIDKLQTALGKNNLGIGPMLNDVGRDLKSHGYNSTYRPPVAIDVNGRPMHPEVVSGELKARGVEVSGDVPRASANGTVQGAMHVDTKEMQEMADKLASDVAAKYGGATTGNLLARTITEHAHKFGVVAKVIGAATAGTLAMAGGANASEIGVAAVDAAAPGLGTLTLGEGPTKGRLCDAFGQVTGAVSGIGAGLAASSVLTPVGGAVVGVGTEAAVTPAATAGCKAVVQKFGL